MALLELSMVVFFGVICALILFWLSKEVVAREKQIATNEKVGMFEWHFDKLLWSYKIKVLKDEIRKRNVKMDELNEIINEALGTKFSNKHVLDEIEEQVKGEVKKASPKTKGGE